MLKWSLQAIALIATVIVFAVFWNGWGSVAKSDDTNAHLRVILPVVVQFFVVLIYRLGIDIELSTGNEVIYFLCYVFAVGTLVICAGIYCPLLVYEIGIGSGLALLVLGFITTAGWQWPWRWQWLKIGDMFGVALFGVFGVKIVATLIIWLAVIGQDKAYDQSKDLHAFPILGARNADSAWSNTGEAAHHWKLRSTMKASLMGVAPSSEDIVLDCVLRNWLINAESVPGELDKKTAKYNKSDDDFINIAGAEEFSERERLILLLKKKPADFSEACSKVRAEYQQLQLWLVILNAALGTLFSGFGIPFLTVVALVYCLYELRAMSLALPAGEELVARVRQVKHMREAMPMLGFIGTLLGLSLAMQTINEADAGLLILRRPGISASLAANLFLAFNTTLVALGAVLLVSIILAQMSHPGQDSNIVAGVVEGDITLPTAASPLTPLPADSASPEPPPESPSPAPPATTSPSATPLPAASSSAEIPPIATSSPAHPATTSPPTTPPQISPPMNPPPAVPPTLVAAANDVSVSGSTASSASLPASTLPIQPRNSERPAVLEVDPREKAQERCEAMINRQEWTSISRSAQAIRDLSKRIRDSGAKSYVVKIPLRFQEAMGQAKPYFLDMYLPCDNQALRVRVKEIPDTKKARVVVGGKQLTILSPDPEYVICFYCGVVKIGDSIFWYADWNGTVHIEKADPIEAEAHCHDSNRLPFTEGFGWAAEEGESA